MQRLILRFRQKIMRKRYLDRLYRAALGHAFILMAERTANDTPDDSPAYQSLVKMAGGASVCLEHDLDYVTASKPTGDRVTFGNTTREWEYNGEPVSVVIRRLAEATGAADA